MTTKPLLLMAAKAGLQSASIMTVADITTQLLVEGRSMSMPRVQIDDAQTQQQNKVAVDDHDDASTMRQCYDPWRTLRWTTVGLTLHGPYFFVCFGKLDKIFGASTTLSVAAKKTIFGQFVVFPPYLTALFTYMGAMEGLKRDEILIKVQDRVPKAFVGGCIFWPIANLFNFRFVPVGLRVPYLASVGGLWNGYLSYMNANSKNESGER